MSVYRKKENFVEKKNKNNPRWKLFWQFDKQETQKHAVTQVKFQAETQARANRQANKQVKIQED